MKSEWSKLVVGAVMAGFLTTHVAIANEPTTAADGTKAEAGKDSCKGKNSCKGKDACGGKDGCKGKNSCKGHKKGAHKGKKDAAHPAPAPAEQTK